jgi:hypothetical protein
LITHIWHEKQPALEVEAAFRTKSMNKRRWPVPGCIALSSILHLQLLLAGLHLTALTVRYPRRWEVEGVEEEAKVWFILFFASSAAAPSSVVPGPP